MNQDKLPLACKLTDAEFQQRRAEILKNFRGAVQETEELETGYRYRFPSTANWIGELAQLITVERECCPFLQFDLRVEAGDGPVWLKLTGPEGTKDFLQTLFAE